MRAEPWPEEATLATIERFVFGCCHHATILSGHPLPNGVLLFAIFAA